MLLGTGVALAVWGFAGLRYLPLPADRGTPVILTLLSVSEGSTRRVATIRSRSPGIDPDQGRWRDGHRAGAAAGG